jgi:hypothetical protein
MTPFSGWTKLITVIVGGTSPESVSQNGANMENSVTKTDILHESIIRAKSPFFEAALCKKWKEAEERVVRIPEQYLEGFDIYMRWVYSGKVIISELDISKEGNADEYVRESTLASHLSRAYVLGDVLQDMDFKDAVVDGLLEMSVSMEWVPFEEAKYLYENTPKDSLMRRMLSDYMVAVNMCEAICKEPHHKYNNTKFLQDVLLKRY